MSVVLSLLGYAELEIDQVHVEKTLNFFLTEQSSFSNLQNTSSGGIRFRCSLLAKKKLFRSCFSDGYIPAVLGYGGLYEQIYGRRRRYGLLLGILCAVFLTLFAERIIWDVRISGNQTVSTADVLQSLSRNGLAIGANKSVLATEKIENAVLMENRQLSWISICVNGTVAEVQVRESDQNTHPESKEYRSPANLVASSDGQIEEIQVFRGSGQVKAGQAVKKGDLLISGIMDSVPMGFRYTRAAGSVLARTHRIFTVEIPYSESQKSCQSEKISKITLHFFGKSRKIYENTGNSVEDCDIIEEVRSGEFFGLHRLPVFLTVEKQRNYVTVTVSRSAEEALQEAYSNLERTLVKNSGTLQLLNKKITTEVGESSLRLTCEMTALENIAEVSEFEWRESGKDVYEP